jgi:hypothetical protein
MTSAMKVEYGWAMRSSALSPELPIAVLRFFPEEHAVRVDSMAAPGARLPRRGSLVLSSEHAETWDVIQWATERGSTLALRAPSGRSYGILPTWDDRYPPCDAETEAVGGLTIRWMAVKVETFNDFDQAVARSRPLQLVTGSDPWGDPYSR